MIILDQFEQWFSGCDICEEHSGAARDLEGICEDNQKLGELLKQVIDNIEQDKDRYKGQDIAVVVNQMRYDAIDTEIKTFAKLWNLNEDDVRYEVYNYRDGEMANENTFKDRAYAA